jgi:hypothetical protein
MGSSHVKVTAAVVCLLGMFGVRGSAQLATPAAPTAIVAGGELWQGTVTVTYENTWKATEFYSRNYKTEGVWTIVGGGTSTSPRAAQLPVRLIGDYSDKEWQSACNASYEHTGHVDVTTSSSESFPSVHLSIDQVSATYHVFAYGASGMGTMTRTSACSPTTKMPQAVGINYGASGAQLFLPRMTRLQGTSRTPLYRDGGDFSQVVTVKWDLTLAPDADHDNIPNTTDKCPTLADPAQLDEDKDGIGDACDTAKTRPGLSEIEAVRKFAPVVRLDRNDFESYPMDPGWFVHKSRLMWASNDRADIEVVARGKVDPRRLGGYTGTTSSQDDPYTIDLVTSTATDTYTTGYQLTAPVKANKPQYVPRVEHEGFYLEGEGKDHSNPNAAASVDNPSFGLHRDPQAPAPIHPSPPTLYYEFADGKYIVYWFFYGLNGRFWDEHEGDWEKVVVKLDDRNGATDVAYYQHYCDPESKDTLYGTTSMAMMRELGYLAADDQGNPTHPIVYSARYAHASYPENISGAEGTYLAKPCGSFFDNGGGDRTSDGGWTWLSAKGSLRNAATEPWYGFGGAWGKKLDTLHGVGWGPLGPGDVMWRTEPPVPGTWSEQWANGATPAGVSITVQPQDLRASKAPARVTFSSISKAGDTFVTVLRERPALPGGFKNGRDYVDLRTTAEHSGTITVCLNVEKPVDATTFAGLGMTHWVGTTATALNVSSRDFATRTVCGTTAKLGTFALATRLEPMLLPDLALSSPSLHFAAQRNGTAFSATTPAQRVMLTQQGIGQVTWAASSPEPWVRVSPTSGVGSGTLTISIDYAHPSLPAFGPATATLNITPTGARNAPSLSVSVEMVTAARAPWGVMDTPADGVQGVTGSLAITGWALDDIETTEVQIWRDAHPNDPAGAVFGGGPPQGGKVFIGHASFVEGARPDVQAGNTTIPLNQRAGWGYLMLTLGMSWDGHGPFKLYAIAADRDGHLTLLGSKTLSINNAASTKPFGAIDTPGQGATASGIFPNTGWVLTPNAGATIPAANVQVAIDGVFLPGVPSVSDRTDISGGFPAFNTSGSGRGLFLDTTKYSNGAHTIGWFVTDSTGQADGVGSRFFTVANGVSALTAPVGAAREVIAAPRASLELSVDAVNALPESTGSLTGRRGFDRDQPFNELRASGIRTALQAEELDRVELRLESETDRYTGYVRVGETLAALPIGSHLASGTFTWQAGVGFVGSYDLVFVRWNGSTAADRTEVRVVLHPQGTLARALVMIDSPAADQSTDGAFTVAGWAADPSSIAGTGIDAIHVWAYPVDRSPAIFLGTATLDGRRPDVAAVHGARFLGSGYGLTVSVLAAGTYDLAVFAWQTASGTFLPARTVRITVR